MKDKQKMQLNNNFTSTYTQRVDSIGETGFILLDIHETKDNFIIEAEVPGVTLEDIEVSLSGNNVVIKGVKDDKVDCEGKLNFFCMERAFGPFKRIIEIPLPILSNMVKADYRNGVLVITLPKAEERRVHRRKITINTV